ncbi:MAG: hypothetical protein DRO40_07995 [Thermoprotei archaeon]|nr:MAG: hypothetical protein DRO40_07995 [Thermoprotei archaeon]
MGRFREELTNALYLSCVDKMLVDWVKDNIVPKYRKYKSLNYVKERLRDIISRLEKSDSRYRVGYTLGLMKHINDLSKMGHRVRAEFMINGKKYVVPSDELVDEESIERELKSYRGLSSYGYGRFLKTVVILASLYSDIYHLPFIEPLPLKTAFDMLLSVRKKRYTMARNVLRCYEDNSKSRSEARECTLREMERVLRDYVGIVGKRKLDDMKKRFLEAFEELMDSLEDLV